MAQATLIRLTHGVSVRDDAGMTDVAPALYHGTVREDLDEVTPATEHRRGVTFFETDADYAYATPNLGDAWHYAWKAWHTWGTGIPRVYRVEPVGDVEVDPQKDARGNLRGNLADDVRSRDGFTVVEEMPFPEEHGDPEEWR